jgi:hypothetical protein
MGVGAKRISTQSENEMIVNTFLKGAKYRMAHPILTRKYTLLRHPVLTFRTWHATNFKHFDCNVFDRFADSWYFAKINHFSKEEREALYRFASSSISYFVVFDRDHNVASLFFVTKLEEGAITGFIARAKKTNEFPDRVDAKPRTFNHTNIRFDASSGDWMTCKAYLFCAALGSLKDTGFELIFDQPCFARVSEVPPKQ